jgi:acetyl-CoA C-acetyltransferase
MIAEKWGLKREELDEFAAQSHCRAAAAQRNGWTRPELFAFNGMEADEGVRANPDLSRMRLLKTVFKADGVVTAANSSQISDGAGAVLLASGRKADELGLRKRARIVARAVVGSDPELMLTGPISATQKALKMAGLTVDQIDVFEINEAFACVPMVWARELQAPMEKLNIQGGAIAHGHPLGGTGAVLMTKMVNILERTGGRYGLQSMCIGFGMATATVIESLPPR